MHIHAASVKKPDAGILLTLPGYGSPASTVFHSLIPSAMLDNSIFTLGGAGQTIFSLDRYQMADLLTHAAKAGAMAVLQETGTLPKQISQNESWRRFGKQNVDRWRKDGKVTPTKHDNRYLYDLITLENLSKTNEI